MTNPTNTNLKSSAAAALQATTNELFWQMRCTFHSLGTFALQRKLLVNIEGILIHINYKSLRHFKPFTCQHELSSVVDMGIRDFLVMITEDFCPRVAKAKAMLAALPLREDLEDGEIDENVTKCEEMVEMVEWWYVCCCLAGLEVSKEARRMAVRWNHSQDDELVSAV